MKTLFATTILMVLCGASALLAQPLALDPAAPAGMSSVCASPGAETVTADLLTNLDPVAGAVAAGNCGAFNCTTSQDCIFCGSQLSCRPAGETCCYPDFCSPTETCILCGGHQGCYPQGSTCCGSVFGGSTVCAPHQTCDNVTQRCV